VAGVRGTVDAVGTRLTYDTVGEGPDLVFLHAGIADRTMWQPQVTAFRGRFRCTTPDARGFGDTPVGAVPFSRRDDLGAVMDAVGAGSATLVGCSIGAGLALDFAIERPERVEKLVLAGVTPSGFEAPGDPFFGDTLRAVDAAIARHDYITAARLEARLWVDGPGRPEGAAPQWLRDQVIAWSERINRVADWGDSLQLDPPAAHRLGEVAAPTLIIVGSADVGVVIAGCRAAAAGIPGAELVELAATAHLPNLEVATEFNAALEAFLYD
jgi:pimeloyl-ACP methyl ester carboxylesterase